MSSAVQDFIAEVLKRWPPPKSWSEEQEDAWSDDVIAEFSSEKEPIFAQALNVLKRQSRSYSGTPRIDDVIKAVNLAVKEVAAQRRAGMLKLGDGDTYDADPLNRIKPDDKAWTREGIKLAYEMLPTEMGRQAAREGWVAPFWQYVVTHRRMPGASDIPALKRAAIKPEDLDVWARKPGAMAKSIYEAMRFRMSDAQRLADIADGKRVPTRQDYYRTHFGGSIGAEAKPSPSDRYADTNAEEGRGWKGVTA